MKVTHFDKRQEKQLIKQKENQDTKALQEVTQVLGNDWLFQAITDSASKIKRLKKE
jgi:hypothetical protein